MFPQQDTEINGGHGIVSGVCRGWAVNNHILQAAHVMTARHIHTEAVTDVRHDNDVKAVLGRATENVSASAAQQGMRACCISERPIVHGLESELC